MESSWRSKSCPGTCELGISHNFVFCLTEIGVNKHKQRNSYESRPNVPLAHQVWSLEKQLLTTARNDKHNQRTISERIHCSCFLYSWILPKFRVANSKTQTLSDWFWYFAHWQWGKWKLSAVHIRLSRAQDDFGDHWQRDEDWELSTPFSAYLHNSSLMINTL